MRQWYDAEEICPLTSPLDDVSDLTWCLMEDGRITHARYVFAERRWWLSRDGEMTDKVVMWTLYTNEKPKDSYE